MSLSWLNPQKWWFILKAIRVIKTDAHESEERGTNQCVCECVCSINYRCTAEVGSLNVSRL